MGSLAKAEEQFAGMRTIHLLGSEGFIGRSIQREADTVDLHCWSHRHSAPDHHFDLLNPATWQALLNQQPHHVILLSWPGLPNYQELFHIARNLPACIELLEQLITAGLQRITIAGSCYEYGLQNGPLREDQPTDPVNCYAIGKDALRRAIATRCEQKGVHWSWGRIFYPYGQGQNQNSLLPSVQRALEAGEPSFSMSSGRQIRDFVPVNDIAIMLITLATHPDAHGIYNCASGVPISLREIVENSIKSFPSQMTLKLGAYQDRSDEPVAFWADTRKIDHLLKSL